MKESEITTEMFNAWKDEMREIFKSEPDSMNLINICLKALENLDYADKQDKFNSQLLDFYKNHLARNGKLMCNDCGKPLTIYYKVYCFHCKKPEIENGEGNYFMAVMWLNNNEPDFKEDDLWSYLVNCEYAKGNDTYMKLPYVIANNKELNESLMLFYKHFPKDVKWFVSW